MKCLVVAHSTTTRRAIVRALRPLECEEIREASEVPEALANFDSSVGLVIASWDPPALDGLDLIRQLRARPDGSPVRFMLVTSLTDKASVLEAIKAGVDGYFLRPFSPEHLRDRITALMTVSKGAETEAKAA
jgi:two-component system chemotaxis response regulator CheY